MIPIVGSVNEAKELSAVVPVLLVVSSAECGPCKSLKSTIAGMDLAADVHVRTLDVEHDAREVRAMGIRSAPTTLLLKEAKITNLFIGDKSESDIMTFVKNNT